MTMAGPIGIFDSGYGGLTVMREIVRELPDYDYIYLGDNARAPYGTRSFETVYKYTLEAVKWFFAKECPLVILACNTASAKALRSIQQQDLPHLDASRRVLGVIRPTTEVVGRLSESRSIGIMATNGTVQSDSYPIEIAKFYPELHVYQKACPLLVPLIENNEHNSEGAEFFVKKYIGELMAGSHDVDTVLLACTHYPLVAKLIRKHLPEGVRVVEQGAIVSASLADYLQRHPEIEARCSKGRSRLFYTTDDARDFESKAELFYGQSIEATRIELAG
jgi:glutamate racemase